MRAVKTCSSRSHQNWFADRRTSRRRRILVRAVAVESLEKRMLLASISGTKFFDANQNGSLDTNEQGLGDWVIFLDGNANGILDGGETSAVTDVDTGAFSFANLGAGTYRVSEVMETGWVQTSPVTGASGTYTANGLAGYVVTLSSSTKATGRNFGNFAPPMTILGQLAIDGDATGGNALRPTINQEDWDVVNRTGAGSDAHSGVVSDTFEGKETTVFTTGGSKDDLDLAVPDAKGVLKPSWKYTSGLVPDKDDITNAYAALYTVTASQVSGDNPLIKEGDQILYFGADRFAQSGDSQIGIWFFKNGVALGPDGSFVDPSTGQLVQHSFGDILMISNFIQGGGQPSLEAFEWVGAGNGSTGSSSPLLDKTRDLAGGTFGTRVNSQDETAPWPFAPKNGSAGTFPTGAFFEGGIDLTLFYRGTGGGTFLPCFHSFVVETRSSQSIGATLKDFVLGQLDTCCSVSGRKFNDLDADGSDDGGSDPGLNGWTILLKDQQGNVLDTQQTHNIDLNGDGTTQSNEIGRYQFDDIQPGTYIVAEQLQNGWVQTAPASPGTYSATLKAGQASANNDFGNILPDPHVRIVKSVNGNDADSAPGVHVALGSTLTFTYVVTNTGNLPLGSVTLSDDKLGAIAGPDTGDSNGNGSLDLGETWTYSKTGSAASGQVQNIGTVNAADTLFGKPVSDSNPANYFGDDARVQIVKLTNGTNNDTGTGPHVALGSAVTWTYNVTATGSNVALTNVVVTDDHAGVTPVLQSGDTNTNNTLDPGETWVYRATGTAVSGQYTNVGTVTARDVNSPPGTTVSATNPDHYFGDDPKVQIAKLTNGTNNDTGTGPHVAIGSTVTWTYNVSNPGNVGLNTVVVTDDHTGVNPVFQSGDTNTNNTLDPGETWVYRATGTAVSGQYTNVGTVTARDVNSPPGTTVSATNPDHYFGDDPKVQIAKLTNGTNNDTGTGPHVAIGSTVTWTYNVSNPGNVGLNTVVVTDDHTGVNPVFQSGDTNTNNTLDPGETWVYRATGTAVSGQYTNVGTVTARDVNSPPGTTVSATNPDHYFGDDPKVQIAKLTNGTNNDTGTGPHVAIGSTVTWTYNVSNPGNVGLNTVVVTDDHTGVNPVFQSGDTNTNNTLDPGETWVYRATGTAVSGQYTNVGTVTARDVNSPPGTTVSATNPDHYFGDDPKVQIAKLTNGTNNDTGTGPHVLVGSIVTWTYNVTASGSNVALTNIVVTDDHGGVSPVFQSGDTNGNTLLDAGETWVYRATGTAVSGQYTNVGTVTARDANNPPGITVSATNPDHYFGDDPKVRIVKSANGSDSDCVHVPAGSSVTFSYVVTNPGNVPIANVTVTDNVLGSISGPSSGDTHNLGQLDTDETWTYTRTASALAGEHENIGTVNGTDSFIGSATITASDDACYFGDVTTLTIVKLTNGSNNDTAPGIRLSAGDAVTWTYKVTNTGNVALNTVKVTDDNGTPGDTSDDLSTDATGSKKISYLSGDNGNNLFDPGETWVFTATGTAITGQYSNIGAVTAKDSFNGTVAGPFTNPDNYFGALPPCDDNYYPFSSTEPRTNIIFNESEVLRAFSDDVTDGRLKIWYNDEHALALGVKQVTIKRSTSTTTKSYPLSSMSGNPSAMLNPQVGAKAGDTDPEGVLIDDLNPAGKDVSYRPMYPVLFITDLTVNGVDSHAGDWQYHGNPYAPSAVFGSWKAFTQMIDYTQTAPDGGPLITLTADADPAKNDWNLAGGDPAPAGLKDEGYGAEIVWNISDLGLIPGHAYRFYVMDHDGDQNKFGGDSGQACENAFYPVPSTVVSIGDCVWNDSNQNGIKDSGEPGINGVTLELLSSSGTVLTTTSTHYNPANGAPGYYLFAGLDPGQYQVRVASSNFATGGALVGCIASPTLQGGNSATDSNPQPAATTPATLAGGATDQTIDFGYYKVTPVAKGQAGTIVFWAGKYGQDLIKKFGNTAGGQTLGQWLATTFPHLYGPGTSATNPYDMTSMTNTQIALLMANTFAKQAAPQGNAEVLSTALSIFATTKSLGGDSTNALYPTLLSSNGFVVTAEGLGMAVWNVGSAGADFGVPNNSSCSVMKLLLAADNDSKDGLLFSEVSNDAADIKVFHDINAVGGITRH